MNQLSPAKVIKPKHANCGERCKTLKMLLEVMGQHSVPFIVVSF